MKEKSGREAEFPQQAQLPFVYNAVKSRNCVNNLALARCIGLPLTRLLPHDPTCVHTHTHTHVPSRPRMDFGRQLPTNLLSVRRRKL